jgi:hypothetical protein
LKASVHVISLDRRISRSILDVFPGAVHFRATDLRGADPMDLLRAGMITDTAFESLSRGRKYHHEFSGIGGVGLCRSVMRLLHDGNGPILVLESDCIPSKSLSGSKLECNESVHSLRISSPGAKKKTPLSPAAHPAVKKRISSERLDAASDCSSAADGELLLHVAGSNGPEMVPPTIAIARSSSWIASRARQVFGRLAPAPVDVTSNQVIYARVSKGCRARQPLNMPLFIMNSAMGPQGALESVSCGVLPTSGSRSFWRRFWHMPVRFDYRASGQILEICRADSLNRP